MFQTERTPLIRRFDGCGKFLSFWDFCCTGGKRKVVTMN